MPSIEVSFTEAARTDEDSASDEKELNETYDLKPILIHFVALADGNRISFL